MAASAAGSRARVVRVAAALLGVALLAPGLQAQQDARGWLGVGLQEQLQCRTGAMPGPRPCERMFVVAQVVVDGPADRAGVQPGDTLLAVAGHPVASADGKAALAAIQPQRPVVLTLGRAQGRAQLRVLPSTRPQRVERVRGAEGPFTARAHVAPPHPVAPGAAGRDVVEVQTDGGQVVRIRNLEAIERQLEAEQELLRSVELQLGPELRRLQDSVFRQAREQLESLRRAHVREQIARAAAAPDQPPPVAPRVELWIATSNERRLAGAEFEALGPELAEFFQAERGLLVLRVLPGTPADRLGLRPGDVVFEAGGVDVSSLEELRRVLTEREGPHRLRWNRKGQAQAGTLPQ